jgi:hypothetical protein
MQRIDGSFGRDVRPAHRDDESGNAGSTASDIFCFDF